MSKRESQRKSTRTSSDEVEEVDTAREDAATDHKAELDDDVDALLDDIDEVLEVNAAEFVQSYVQKGGQ